jgi:serine/threonine protein kinase
MPTDRKKRNILLRLAAEGVVPVIGGCAGALIGGPVGGLAGVVVAQSVEKAINLFGKGIVERWRAWFAGAAPEERAAAVAELAALPPEAARNEARDALIELAPDADPQDLSVALEYLSSLPKSLSRALVLEVAGQRSLPPTVTWEDTHSLLQLLPQDIPPYAASAELPGTPYRLEELLGSGGFGAVYRASSPTLQHLPLAIKFCLDRSLLPALNLERSNLERLMRAGGERGSGHVVKLYGYDLDHATPYLVYEFVPGGDLTGHLARHRAETGRAMTPAEVLGVVTQLAEGLAFAHRAGLVHRDVKPANVLVDGSVLKLADFGLGGVAVRRAVERSRIGATTIDYLSLAERASLFRGAGTPLYMSPEQRRGANPDPRHDLYSLGVLWFQLLAGDVTRELHPGWAKELAVRFGVPAGHIALIDRCVGWFDERPKDAGELLPLLREAASDAALLPVARDTVSPLTEPLSRPRADTAQAVVTPSEVETDTVRKHRLLELLQTLQGSLAGRGIIPTGRILIAAGLMFLVVGLIAGAIAAVQDNDGTAVFIGLAFATPAAIAFGLVLYLGLWWWASRRRWVTERTSIIGLGQEFPAEVEAWGGPDRLRSPAVVLALRTQVAQPTFRVSPAATAAAAAPTSVKPLRSGPQAPPLWAAVALATVLGGLVGLGAGLLTDRITAPLKLSGYTLHGLTGTPLKPDEADARRRINEIVAPIVGVVAGLGAFGVGTWVLSRPRRFLWPTIAAGCFGLFVLGLPVTLAVNASVDALLHPRAGAGKTYLDHMGRSISEEKYYEISRKVEIMGGVAGVAAALLVTVVTVSLVRWRYRFNERTAQPGAGEPAAPSGPSTSTVVTPDLLRADRMGMTVLRSRLLDYANVRKYTAITNVLLAIFTLAIILPIALICMGIIGRGVSDAWLAVLVAFPVGAGIIGSAVLAWTLVRRKLRARQRALADELSRTYGPVFERWGGPAFLDDSKAVNAVLAELFRRDQPPG